MVSGNPLKGVAGVDDQLCLRGDPGVVIGGVVCHQEDQIGLSKVSAVRGVEAMSKWG